MHYEAIESLLQELEFWQAGMSAAEKQQTLEQVKTRIANVERQADFRRWHATLGELPSATATTLDLASRAIVIGTPSECDVAARRRIEATLLALRPWRKGPFNVFGIELDAEWRSDMKWARLANRIEPLTGRSVLDVGSGNGYYSLRALGDGAASVLGIEPNALFVLQFEALRRLLPALPVAVLPLRLEELPAHPRGFDTVFSMGVLYHRRSPMLHLGQLHASLRDGGQLVLETLIVEEGDSLAPPGRYANMRNVWCLPSIRRLLNWLEETGFVGVELVDVTRTTMEEQRATPWMRFHSLAQALSPSDPGLTVEGYPAPTRAMLTAWRRGSVP